MQDFILAKESWSPVSEGTGLSQGMHCGHLSLSHGLHLLGGCLEFGSLKAPGTSLPGQRTGGSSCRVQKLTRTAQTFPLDRKLVTGSLLGPGVGSVKAACLGLFCQGSL